MAQSEPDLEPQPAPEPPSDADAMALAFEAAPTEVANDLDGPEVRRRIGLAATREGLELTIEPPGLGEKDVQIEGVRELPTISGELRFSSDHGDKSDRLVERAYGAVTRTVALPEGFQIDGIHADLSRGLLTVAIPSRSALSRDGSRSRPRPCG